MNDKEKLLRDYARMCIRGKCDECRIGEKCNFNCGEWIAENPKEATQIIEQWADEHPVKTRQVLFLEQSPNALLDNHGRLNINPCIIDVTLKESDMCNSQPMCFDCRIDYWKEEVE